VRRRRICGILTNKKKVSCDAGEIEMETRSHDRDTNEICICEEEDYEKLFIKKSQQNRWPSLGVIL